MRITVNFLKRNILEMEHVHPCTSSFVTHGFGVAFPVQQKALSAVVMYHFSLENRGS